MSAESRGADVPDLVLVRRFLRGDETAFRALYARHTPRLAMTIRRLLGPRRDDAEDVVQETWLSACRGMAGFRGDARFSSWLTSIGVRAAYAFLARRRLHETELRADLEIEATRSDGPAATIDLDRALAALPDVPRMVVVLHDVEGFTHEEIAEQLGMATGTSKATLSRARHALRQALTTGAFNAKR